MVEDSGDVLDALRTGYADGTQRQVVVLAALVAFPEATNFAEQGGAVDTQVAHAVLA